ncbi:MAG: AAA family ATPase [Phycisphaerae bacterium]
MSIPQTTARPRPHNVESPPPAPRDDAPPDAPVIDVPLPDCDPAEAALIGSVGYDVTAINLATSDMFALPLHQMLWRELTAFINHTDGATSDTGGIDAVGWTEWLKARGVSKADRDYFTDCVKDVPSAAGADGYAGIVKYKYACRELIRLSQDIANGASGDAILDTVIATAQSRLMVLAQIGQAGGLGAVMQCVAEVEARQVDWLWPGRIPLGRISMLVGRPGEGKSFLTAYMAAIISVGGHWPDGMYCPQGSVILVSGEDDPGDTIRPRLDAHGADCTRIYILKTVAYCDSTGAKKERGFTLADIPQLERALIDHPGIKLIVIDPIGSFLGGKVDGHRDNEIRSVLAPLAALAEKYSCAVLIVAHRRKSAAASADDMALGSIGFVGLSRAVWHLSRDENNTERRLLLPGKMNLCRQPDGLAFCIGGEPASIRWESEPVQMSADDHQAVVNGTQKPGPKPETKSAAEKWLSELLKLGSKTVSEIKEESKSAGFGWMTVQRAADDLKVIRERDTSTGKWRWYLSPPDGEKTNIPSSPDNLVHRKNLVSWYPRTGQGENTQNNNNISSSLRVVSSSEIPPTVPPVTLPAGSLFSPPAKAPEPVITPPATVSGNEEII